VSLSQLETEKARTEKNLENEDRKMREKRKKKLEKRRRRKET
jgi:hypothetical protein